MSLKRKDAPKARPTVHWDRLGRGRCTTCDYLIAYCTCKWDGTCIECKNLWSKCVCATGPSIQLKSTCKECNKARSDCLCVLWDGNCRECKNKWTKCVCVAEESVKFKFKDYMAPLQDASDDEGESSDDDGECGGNHNYSVDGECYECGHSLE